MFKKIKRSITTYPIISTILFLSIICIGLIILAMVEVIKIYF
jgi:hypothetical protein